MPEILTESFCERCGTRYTFESGAPRRTRRLGQIKTLSKGMKNWVMSDDTSLDEAMAAARNDDDRELTSHQLDAFHATFNFCMTCRQYTCSNCWNTTEGRCLTCAPHLGHEILPAPFPEQVAVEPVRIEAEAWPEVDLSAPGLAAGNGNGNGHVHDVAPGEDPWQLAGAPDIDIPEIDPAARLAFLSGEAPTPSREPEPPTVAADSIPAARPVDNMTTDAADVADVADAADVADVADVADQASVRPAADVERAHAPIWTPTFLGTAGSDRPAAPHAAADEAAAAADLAPAEPAVAAAAPTEAGATEDLPPTVEGRAHLGAARTSDLLSRFRPGQNIDAELAAYEASLDAVATDQSDASDQLVASAGAGAAEADAAAAEPQTSEPEAEPAVDAASAETAAAETATAETATEPEAAPEVAASAPSEPAPLAAAEPVAVAEPVAAEPPRQDHVPQPTWQIFAPDAGQPATPAAPAQPPAAPQWPVHADQIDSPAMALLANRANRSSSDALWAASAQEVLARPANAPAAGAPAGVQPCSSCGLSLSATARFCRRCGTRQG